MLSLKTLFVIIYVIGQLFCIANTYVLTCYTPAYTLAPEKINAKLCTHLFIIGNTIVDTDGLILLPNSTEVQPYLALKKDNPDLKILPTLTPDNRIMSRIVLDDGLMDQMANTLAIYLTRNNLDGFDIDWEFPVWSIDARKTDKKGLSTLLKKIRQRFDQEQRKLLLILTIGAPYTIIKKGYDIDVVNRYVDYLQIMTYDFHDYSHLEPITGFNAPLRAASYEFSIMAKMNSDYSVKYLLRMGINKNITVFGVPTYGRGYRLMFKHLHFPYAPASGPSKYGIGLDYPTICNLTAQGYIPYWSNAAATGYWVKDYQWLSSENARSVRIKTNYAKEMGLAGVMIFGMHTDDYDNECGTGKYPLISAIHETLYSNATIKSNGLKKKRKNNKKVFNVVA